MGFAIYQELIGRMVQEVIRADDEILFFMADGSVYRLYHEQSCCEMVHIEDITGDVGHLSRFRLVQAECSYQKGDDIENSETWSFFRFGTIRGSITVRFYGSSNGYYSESANLYVWQNGGWVTVTPLKENNLWKTKLRDS